MPLVSPRFGQRNVMLLAVGEDVVIGQRELKGSTSAQSHQRYQSHEVWVLDTIS